MDSHLLGQLGLADVVQEGGGSHGKKLALGEAELLPDDDRHDRGLEAMRYEPVPELDRRENLENGPVVLVDTVDQLVNIPFKSPFGLHQRLALVKKPDIDLFGRAGVELKKLKIPELDQATGIGIVFPGHDSLSDLAIASPVSITNSDEPA